jgi:Ala-tRNA(Pro) deacylase
MIPAASRDLLARLDAMGVATETHHHPAVFTVAESGAIKKNLPGAHSKNLFLKDRKGRLFLVVADHATRIDLKRLHDTIGASGRLSFGSADLLREVLGVEPGSVTPFAVINDSESRVTVILDSNLMAAELLNFHPLVNTMTTAIGREDLVTFLRATGHDPRTEKLPDPPDEICMAGEANPS